MSERHRAPDPGKNPPETCVNRVLRAAEEEHRGYAAFGIRGVGIDQKSGVAWAAFSSGQIGRFDRNKCKVINGPTANRPAVPGRLDLL